MQLTIRQKELLTGLSVPVLGLLLMLAGETAVRLIEHARFGTAANVDESDVFYRDEVTGLRLPRPSVRLGHAQINSNGMRGPNIELTAEPGTVRIAFLGSSTTYDANSPEGKTWPDVTVSELRKKLPDDCSVDYLNGGLPGFGTSSMLKYFLDRINKFKPAVVIILPGDVTNDIQSDLKSRGIDYLANARPSWLAKRSRLWSRIEKTARAERSKRTALSDEGKLDFDIEALAKTFEERLLSLTKTVQASGSLPVLVTMTGHIRRDQTPGQQVKAAETHFLYNPYVSIPTVLDARDAYNRAIKRVADATGAVLVQGTDAVPGDGTYFADSMHFTPVGSAVMGGVVASELADSVVVRERFRSVSTACAISN